MMDLRCEARGVILVVDDEPAVRLLARRFLEPAGYAVIEAEDGRDALAILERGQHVDFLVVDLDMPVMRGEELAGRLRILRPDLRVLYVTAQSEALFEAQAELKTGEAFLDKPFSQRGLLEAVSLLKNGYINEPARQPTLLTQVLHRLVPGLS